MPATIKGLSLSILKASLLVLTISIECQAVTPSGPWFVGCYKDVDVLSKYSYIEITHTAEILNTTFNEQNAIKCGMSCASKGSANKFAAFSQTGLCLCSLAAYNISDKVSDSLCQQKSCDFNNITSDCDGITYHWLVDTSKILTAVNIETSDTIIGSIPQNITAALVPANASVSFTFDFGDGTIVDFLTTKYVSYVYKNAGFYKVTIKAESTSNRETVSASKVLKVETAPFGSNFSVPVAVETEKDLEFAVSILEGNNMTVNGKVLIGEAPMTGFKVNDFFVEDARIITVGASTYDLMRASPVFSSPNTGLYLMPQFKFPADGIIAAFTAFVTKIGYLRFQVYRPVCSSGVYCYSENGCNNTCIESVDMMTNVTAKSTAILGTKPKYTLNADTSFFANATGLKYFKLKTGELSVKRGDVIGLKLMSGEGDIGHKVIGSVLEYHAALSEEIFPGQTVNIALSNKNVQHMMQAHLSTTSSIKMKAMFSEPGVANIKITAKHSTLTDYNGNRYLHVQERITDFKATKPVWYSTQAYELGKVLTMQTSKSKGSNITYEWQITLGAKNFTFNNTEGTLQFKPNETGIYKLFAQAKNLINKENMTIEFSVQEKIVEVTVQNLTNGVLISKSGALINVSIHVLNGTNVTLTATLEGETKTKFIPTATGGYTHTFQFPALKAPVCKKSSVAISAKNDIPASDVSKTAEVAVVCPIEGLKLESIPEPTTVDGKERIITGSGAEIQLTVNIEQGSFVVYELNKGDPGQQIDKKNHSTKAEPSTVVFTFQYSSAKIYQVTLNLTNQISSASKVIEVEITDCQAEVLEISGSPESQNPTFITRGQSYKVTGTIKVPECNSNVKPKIIYKILFYRIGVDKALEEKPVSKMDLVYIIPKLAHPAGQYKVTFKQNYTTPDGPQVIQKNAYVTIKQTPLFAMIDSGSSRVVPLKKRLTKDANATSFYNISLDGSASTDPDNSSTLLAFEWYCRSDKILKPIKELKYSVCNHTDLREYRRSQWGKQVVVETKQFALNATYIMVLKVKHKDRESNYSQQISFLEGEPPAVEFECVTNCDTKWNIQEKIILRGKCPNCVDIQDIEYDWSLKWENGSAVKRVSGSVDPTITSTGWKKQNLVINAGQLKDNKVYKVILRANYKGKTKITTIILERKTASIPYGGVCEMNPKTGTVAQTKFQIRCEDWKSVDIPMRYEFMTKTVSESTVEVTTVSRKDYPIWYTGNEPRNPQNILPLGDPKKDYNLTIIVRIYNAFGSFRELDPIIVQVKNIDTSKKDVNATSVIEDSKPKTNDSASLSQWAASAASILNEESTTTASKPDSSSDSTKEDLSKTRAKIISSLSNADLNEISLSTLKQLGEALGSVVSKVDEINEESEDIGADFLNKMAESFLNNKEANVGAEFLEQASISIMGPLSDLMSATTTKSEQFLELTREDSSNQNSQSGATPTSASGVPTNRPTKKQIQEQVGKTKAVAEKYMNVLDSISERLFRNKVTGEVATVTKTDSFSIALVKKTLRDLEGAKLNTGDESLGVTLPQGIFNEIVSNGSTLTDNETEISLQSNSMKKILHTWDTSNAQNSASQIESLKMLSRQYQSYNVSNLTAEITINILNRPEKLNTTRFNLTFPQEMSIRKEKLKSLTSPLLVEFGSPDNSSSNLTILIQYGYPPSKSNYDAKLVITSKGIALTKSAGNVSINGSTNATSAGNATNNRAQHLVRNSHIRVIDGKTIILWDFSNFTYGFLANRDLYFNFYYTGRMPDPILIPNEYTFDILEVRRSRNYSMRTFSASCLYWNEPLEKWTDDGCRVDPYQTTFNKTICKCNHLTSFGGFYVKPRPIPPLSADMFLKGYVLFVAVTVVLAFYVIGLVLARRADKKDIMKVGVCPLPDNNPDHNYLYQITVWTGLRRDAGTKSNVYFILSGDKGDTRIRHLKDPERKTFQQNSSDVFIFSTETSLGDLSHVRIWHDNSGGGWYLRKLVITDIQADKTYQFLCNRWLAVDRDDGQLEMVAPVSGNEDLTDFNYVFMTKTRSDLSDAHLWFSLYARPPRSPFTRCQRLTCCISLLMTSMLTSAMFYETFPKPTPETANYAAGLTFTWKQVYVAIVSAAITIPINIIIVTLFRSSKPKDLIEIKKKSSSREGSKASLADDVSLKSSDSSATLRSPESPIFNQNSKEPLLVKGKEGETKKGIEDAAKEKDDKKKSETFLFPYWCMYVAWFLSFVAIVSSSVVVIIYGMVFGNSTSLEWLSSVLLCFVQDIIVIQPIKIFVIAIFIAAIVKKVQDERPNVEEQGKKLAEDEDWLHAHADTSLSTAVDTTSLRPPEGVKLDAMRELRFKERKMYAIVREILLYTFFVMVTFSISYSLREVIGFWQTNGLERLFNLPTKESGQFEQDQFSGVLSYNRFWDWSEKVLVDQLFPLPWYDNPAYPQKTREFPGKLLINDLNHKIVNGVRLRQVRVTPDSCKKTSQVKDVVKIDCAAPYGITSEDKSHSVANWTRKVEKRPKITRSNQPWLYQEWKELDGYPFMAELTTYFGGGYTQELFPRWPNKENLQKLKEARWLDRHTRAVIIEFALFNPATNHFSMVTITFEFAATGGCIHYYSIYTFKLYRYTTGYAFFTIVCEVIFLLLLLLYMYREMKEWYQLRSQYFRQFWNLVEVIINILSLVAIGFYFYRQKLADDLLGRLPSKKPETFINFQFAAYIDQVFIYIVSLIVFFVSIKFVKLLRFNRRMSILAETLKDAWYPLGMFSIVMGIVLTSTFAFATIVFGRNMYGYRNMLVTAATQISLLLGKFSFYEYQSTNRVIGPIFFFLYIIMVNWILLNMFLSIINDSYEVVSNGLKEQSNDYEIVDFMMDQFKTWIGHGKTRKEEIQQNIRWQSAKKKMDAVRAFSANSTKKEVHWGDDDILSGLTRSAYWHEDPSIFEKKDLDSHEINKTVDRFIECINLLYFDDTEVAEKMTKKVKQEISDYDYFEQQKKSEGN